MKIILMFFAFLMINLNAPGDQLGVSQSQPSDSFKQIADSY